MRQRDQQLNKWKTNLAYPKPVTSEPLQLFCATDAKGQPTSMARHPMPTACHRGPLWRRNMLGPKEPNLYKDLSQGIVTKGI